MRSEKRYITERMELSNQGKIRTLGEKETNNFLGILEVDMIKQAEMKEEKYLKKEYPKRMRKLRGILRNKQRS